ncbi:MAG: hypothetical protein AAB557_06145 [Patescibacteria group bacterium]
MAELLNFEQTQSVADYLSREIIGRRTTQKFVRMSNDLAIGPEQYHQNVADAAGLELFELEIPEKISQFGCHDGAEIVYHDEDNRLVFFGTTTLRLVTPDNIFVEESSMESYRRRELQIKSCRTATCILFETVITLLPSHPTLFSTISDEIGDAELFQS